MHAGLTFATETNTVTGINTRWYFHRQGLGLFHIAATVTGVTGILDLLATSLTARTGLLHRKETLLHTHLTVAGTGTAINSRSAGLGTAAITGLTSDCGRDANLDRLALHRVFQ